MLCSQCVLCQRFIGIIEFCLGRDIYSTVCLHIVGRSSPPLVLLCKQKLTDRAMFSEEASLLLCSPLKSSRSVGEVCFPHRAVVWGRPWQAGRVGRRQTCTGLRSMESNLSSVWNGTCHVALCIGCFKPEHYDKSPPRSSDDFGLLSDWTSSIWRSDWDNDPLDRYSESLEHQLQIFIFLRFYFHIYRKLH